MAFIESELPVKERIVYLIIGIILALVIIGGLYLLLK